jgi:tetratricopeptide (TPR) repeat protein/predicted Ser/Thr protein kinase
MLIGKTISHYKILEKLGEGGMGVVYKAEDTKLKRLVALKFLPSSIIASEAEKTRFIHEAQAAAALNHPNICTIYEIDEVDGQAFIAMEFVAGETLQKRVVKGEGRGVSGGLQVAEVIDITIQIAQGLAKAHEHGITHRDIKPANVMITKEGVAKILDFGLAKLAGQPRLTKTGSTLGTMAYMSPEQARGEEVDHRTDIWALGVVLYEMITGQLPFKGEYEHAIMYSILNEAPQPITSLHSEAPLELESVINKSLVKQAAQRYQHVDELLADLRRVNKEPESKEAFPRTRVRTRILKKVLSKRGWVLPAVMLGVLILAAAGYFLFFKPKEVSAARIPIAVVDFVNETEEKELNGLSGILITALEQSRRLSVLTRSRMFDILKQMGKQEVDRIDETLGRAICQRANVNAMAIASVRKLGRRYAIDLKVLDPQKDEYLFTTKEEDEGQESIFAMIDRLAEKTREALKEKETEVQAASQKVAEITTPNLEAYQHYFKGEELIDKLQFEGAQEELNKAVALDTAFGLAYYRLAYAISWQNMGEQLEKAPLEKALALIDHIPEKERYLVRAEKARSEKGFAAGVAVLREMEQNYPNDKEMFYNMGDWSFHLGQYTAAVEYLEKVLAIDPTVERALQHLTMTYREMGNNEKMLEMAKRYVSVASSEESYCWLAEAHTRLGDFQMAASYLERARELWPQSWRIAEGMAKVHVFYERFDKAEAEVKPFAAGNQPIAVRRSAVFWLLLFSPYVGKYSESLRWHDQYIEWALQSGDTAEAAFWQLGKRFYAWEGWKVAANERKQIEKTLRLKTMHQYWDWLSAVMLDAAFRESVLTDSLTNAAMKSLSPASYFSLLALVYSMRHECAKAEKSLFEAVQANLRPSYAITNYFYLAQCQFEAGEFDKAVQHLQRIRTSPNDDVGNRAFYYPKGFYLLGKIYEQKGDKPAAIANYKKLLELWKNGDQDLAELKDAKARLAKLKGITKK